MSIRERIVIALAFASLLYGAYEFLSTRDSTRDPGRIAGDETLAAFVERISMHGGSGRLAASEREIIRWAGQAWADRFDLPYLPPPVFDRMPVFSGFIQMEGRTLAVVDGREYAAGERLEQGGYVIKEIAPHRIVIGGEDRRDIPIPLLDLERSASP